MFVLIFPLRKSDAQAFLRHGIKQRYNAYLLSVSFGGMHQRNYPSDKRILLRYKGHTEDNVSHAFPYGNGSYPIVLIDRWRETYLRKRVSDQLNQIG